MQPSANYASETFIPCRRTDLVTLILQDGQLSLSEQEMFRKFSTLLSAYYHFRFHRILETMKESYAPFDPNHDFGLSTQIRMEQRNRMEVEVIENFREILQKANYQEFSLSRLKQTLLQQSLVSLRTDVNFEDFKHIICYYRAEREQEITSRRFFRTGSQTIEVLDRIVLLIQYKDERYFKQKEIDINSLNFVPGKIYLYFYKDVPKLDLELLFPNVQTRMTLKDQLMLLVPATGMGIIVLVRILPQLLLVLGVILFIFEAPAVFDTLKASEAESRNLMPVLVSTFSLAIALGGFGFKQYSNYKSKRIQFQKKVTETLFFRNVANHSAVFQMFIDVAEEEECKEIILAYYQLLISEKPLDLLTLNQAAERWLQAKLGKQVNFDIDDAIQKLSNLGCLIEDVPVRLLSKDGNGYFHVLSLAQATCVLDHLWDDAFQ